MPPDKVLALDNAEAALAELHSIMGPGDVVLVKGSRAVRMDEIATALTDASLPAQDAETASPDASATLSMTRGGSRNQEA
jgi:hypothetical protein